MIGLPEQVSIYLYPQSVDFRKGFDRLMGIVTAALGHNVTDGSLFLFVNRKRARVKALWWETGGLTLGDIRDGGRFGSGQGRQASASLQTQRALNC